MADAARAETHDDELDAIALQAALIADAPAAVVAVQHDGRFDLVGRAGVAGLARLPLPESPPYPPDAREPVVAEDVRRMPELSRHPLLAAWPGARLLVLAPIHDRQGAGLGVLAVLDRRSHPLLEEQRQGLKLLARHAAAILELRRRLKMLARVVEALPEPLYAFDLQGRIVYANSAGARAAGVPQPRLIGQTLRALPPGARSVIIK